MERPPVVWLSLVVPVYNRHTALVDVLAELAELAGQAGWRWEAVLVDDGSPNPQVWPALQQLAGRYPGQVLALRLATNRGQQVATWVGLNHARGTWRLTADDDGQHPLEALPALLGLAQDGERQLVYGRWMGAVATHSPRRNLLGRLARRLHQLQTGQPPASAFRLIDGAFWDEHLKPRATPPFNLDQALRQAATRLAWQPLVPRPSQYPGSRYKETRLARYALAYAGRATAQPWLMLGVGLALVLGFALWQPTTWVPMAVGGVLMVAAAWWKAWATAQTPAPVAVAERTP